MRDGHCELSSMTCAWKGLGMMKSCDHTSIPQPAVSLQPGIEPKIPKLEPRVGCWKRALVTRLPSADAAPGANRGTTSTQASRHSLAARERQDMELLAGGC